MILLSETFSILVAINIPWIRCAVDRTINVPKNRSWNISVWTILKCHSRSTSISPTPPVILPVTIIKPRFSAVSHWSVSTRTKPRAVVWWVAFRYQEFKRQNESFRIVQKLAFHYHPMFLIINSSLPIWMDGSWLPSSCYSCSYRVFSPRYLLCPVEQRLILTSMCWQVESWSVLLRRTSLMIDFI